MVKKIILITDPCYLVSPEEWGALLKDTKYFEDIECPFTRYGITFHEVAPTPNGDGCLDSGDCVDCAIPEDADDDYLPVSGFDYTNSSWKIGVDSGTLCIAEGEGLEDQMFGKRYESVEAAKAEFESIKNWF